MIHNGVERYSGWNTTSLHAPHRFDNDSENGCLSWKTKKSAADGLAVGPGAHGRRAPDNRGQRPRCKMIPSSTRFSCAAPADSSILATGRNPCMGKGGGVSGWLGPYGTKALGVRP